MFSTVKKVFYLFDQRTRKQLLFIFGLMLLCSILEIGGIGSVVPFVTVLADPDVIESNRWLRMAKEFFGIDNPRDFLVYMSLGLVVFFIGKNSFIGIMKYLQLRFVYSKRSSLGKKLFRLYLNCPYTFHLEHNTAELLRNVGLETARSYAFVQNLLTFCTELCVMLAIVVLLVLVDPFLFICGATMLAVAGGIFYKLVNKYSRVWGKILQSSQKEVGQAVIEGLGAIKDVKVLGREKFFPDRLYLNLMENAHAQWMQSTLTAIPLLVLEVFAIGGIVLVIIVLQGQGKNVESILPMVALFAMATVRLMPGVSRMISCLQNFRFYSSAVDLVYEDLNRLSVNEPFMSQVKQPLERPLQFERELRIKNVNYTYPKSKEKAVRGISLKISKGEAVGFAGPTGSGKTTLANIILGLLEPSQGEIYADGQDVFEHLSAWQRNIGYVSQSIYLLDASIRGNVAFGIEEEDIDNSMVWEALKMAQLEPFVNRLPNGVSTIIGENGVKISGGERQRLGIARALYHRPKILMLDEATSALDNETEEELSRALERLSGDKTLIIIAHRFSTIRKCDCIYFMQNGSVVDSGTFDELCMNNSDFKHMAESGDLGI